MIQANELRIGNYFMLCGELIKANVEDILKCRRSPSIRRPIKITPEILEKCGFVLISKNSYWCFKNEVGFVLCMWMADSCVQGFEVKGSFYYGDSYIEIKYLHQLQNLYFALTGKELTVNL